MSFPNDKSGENGVAPLESQPLLNGASSPRESAMLNGQQKASEQNAMNKSGGKRYKGKGGSGTMQVPQFSGPGAGANAGSVASNTTNSQGGANAVCDKCFGDVSAMAPELRATCQGPECNPVQAGGACSSCGGGLIPNGQTWGCVGGGKRRNNRRLRQSKRTKKTKKTKKMKKSKKTKKTKKTRKLKKSRKTRKSKK